MHSSHRVKSSVSMSHSRGFSGPIMHISRVFSWGRQCRISSYLRAPKSSHVRVVPRRCRRSEVSEARCCGV